MHFRLLDAYERAYQDGQAPIDAVIAKHLHCRRETICRWRRRNPALRDWITDHIGKIAMERRPFVDRRITHLAEAGSVDHAKLYYQFVAKVGTPMGEGDVPGGGQIVVTNNFLVPRPDYAGAATAAALPAATVSSVPAPSAAAPKFKVPVVSVR